MPKSMERLEDKYIRAISYVPKESEIEWQVKKAKAISDLKRELEKAQRMVAPDSTGLVYLLTVTK